MIKNCGQKLLSRMREVKHRIGRPDCSATSTPRPLLYVDIFAAGRGELLPLMKSLRSAQPISSNCHFGDMFHFSMNNGLSMVFMCPDVIHL
ncbi:unnamed protein product [Wuchereria bancrofti]|uniref:Uncharacterized protein n=1 Tax=Wuchereria bancrofti TaxID=6293 RepID=A0A3P7E510_WUCBA|nr:unnamed protein product [Wuchereria bancrofti]